MKKLLALLIFATSIVNAQYSIKGTMVPPDKGDWVILYKIEGPKQKFISNTTIKTDTAQIGGQKQVIGKFEFQLPKTAKTGVYRATYKNRGNGYVDFYFNKENVHFLFNSKNPEETVVFTSSRENKLFQEYLRAYNAIQQRIDELQVSYIDNTSKEIKKSYKKELKTLEETQDFYENKSEGMLVHTFIKASQHYNSSNPENNLRDYLASTAKNFFNFIDFKSEVLFNSPIFVDKINHYLFYLNFSENFETQQQLLKGSIKNVVAKIPSGELKNRTIIYLINVLTERRNGPLVDWLFENYYNKLPKEVQDAAFKKETLAILRATVGRIAPDFSWKENGKNMKLSTLNDGEKYLLVFWSTRCPHCVKEVPDLYEFMQQNYKEVSTVSFGIENDTIGWSEFVKMLPNWHNAIGTHPENKWDNEIVRTYQLLATPSYFILDKNKKIVAMPEHLEDVKNYFERN